MLKENTNPDEKRFTRMGKIISLIFILLLIVLNLGRDNLPWKYYSVHIEMSDAQGLQSGSPIFFQGTQIGYIKEVQLDEQPVLLRSRLKRTYQLPKQLNKRVKKDDYKGFPMLDLSIIISDDVGSWEAGDTIR